MPTRAPDPVSLPPSDDARLDAVFDELRCMDEEGVCWPEPDAALVARVLAELGHGPVDGAGSPDGADSDVGGLPRRAPAHMWKAGITLVVALALVVGGVVWFRPGPSEPTVQWRSTSAPAARRGTPPAVPVDVALRAYAMRPDGPVSLHERPGTELLPGDLIAVQYRSSSPELPYLLVYAEDEAGQRVPLVPSSLEGLALTVVADGARHSILLEPRVGDVGLSGGVRLTAAFLPIRVSLSQLRYLRDDGYERRSVKVRLP